MRTGHEKQIKFLEMEIEESWQKKRPTNRKPVYLKPLKDLQKGIKSIAKSQDRVSNTFQATQQTYSTNFRLKNTIKLYKNKNVKDLKYYENCPFNFVIGWYSEAQPFEYLELNDFQTLGEGKMLSNFLIDILMHLIMKQSNVVDIVYIDTYKTQRIFNGSMSPELRHYFQLEKTYLLIRHVAGNHWCLIAINMATKEFTYFDPLIKATENVTKVVGIMKTVLKTLHISSNNWNVRYYDHPLQRDGFNCGVYVLTFAENIIKKQFNFYCCNEPEDQRVLFKKLILKKSDNMFNRCLICGQTSLNVTAQWVQCNLCTRWYMEQCLAKLNIDTSGINPDATYTCPICSKYITQQQ